MAWFGDTFGDGLSSIKGQITKFTNDVLSEDPLAASSFEGRIKQLEEKNTTLKNEIDKLQNENRALTGGKGCELSDYQIQSICELESKIYDLTNEKETLTKALDEIETEHQKELEVVIKDRDRLKAQDSSRKIIINNPSIDETSQLNEEIKSLQLQNDILFEEGKSKDEELKTCFSETEKLNSQVSKLQLQIDQFNDNSSKFNQSKYALKEKNEEIKRLEADDAVNLDNISNLNSKIKILEENYQSEKCKNSELLNTLEENNKIISEKDESLENLNSSLKHFEKENGLLINKLNELSNSASFYEINLKNKISNLEKTSSDLDIQNAELNERLLTFDLLSNEKDKLINDNTLIEAEMTDLKTKFQLLETENVQLKNCIESEDGLENKLKLLEKEVENLMLRNAGLEEIIKDHDTLVSDTSVVETKLEENTEEIDNLRAENKELLLRIKNIVDENATIVEMLTKEKHELQTEIKNMTSQNSQNKLKDLNKKLRLENTTLKKENNGANEKLTAFTLEMQNEISELKSNYEKKLEQLGYENNRLNSELDKLSEKTRLTEELKESIADLNDQNEKLNKRIEDISNLTAEMEKLKLENSSLREENNKLEVNFNKQTEEVDSPENNLDVLKSEYEQKLENLEKENTELKVKIDNYLENAKENEELRNKLEKLEVLVARTEERDNLVSGTLGLEIRKLKSLVGRIRKEFLRSPNEQADVCEEEPTDNVMIQSQTDDVKRLQQDVLQMTEVIKMIDQGLTSIYEDKSKLEKELSIVQSLAVKTEQELLLASKAKQQLEINIQEWAGAVNNRDEIIQHLSITQNTLENDCLALKRDKDELNAKILVLNQELEKNMLEKTVLSEKIKGMELVSLEWNKRIDELQKLYTSESERCEELRKRKDEEIVILNKKISGIGNDSSNEAPEGTSPVELKDMQDQVARLLDENSDLKVLIQQLRENIIAMNTKLPEIGDNDTQHKRSQSQSESQRNDFQTEQLRYQSLLAQHKSLIEKESSQRREVERLRAHMVEVEENYTEEAVVAKTELAELRAKFSTVEDQLQKATSVHKSANVRSTQHVEALQVQVQLIAEQRNDLQNKLSDAEDEDQKQAAALASLQLVLEQFQLDKQREMKGLEERLEYRIDLERRRGKELEVEVENLKQQLSEAKNGLKAALRLGEQLEKKSLVITDLENELKKTKNNLQIVENNLKAINQSSNAKIDKFLVKNLVVGYLSAQGEHKNQALKILTSVLELTAEERIKVGIETQSGWLSHLLHPSPNTAPSESLSQAFVRFLESESKPQPQLKLLTESPKSHGVVKRTPLVLSDLVLPPVTPTQVTDTSLSDMLKDS